MTEADYRYVKAIFLAGSLASIVGVSIGTTELEEALRNDLVPQAQAVVQKASTTLDKGNAILAVQQDYWAQELKETRKATADLHDLLIHTDISLNGRHGDGGILGDVHANLLPRLDNTLDASTSAIRDFSDESSLLLSRSAESAQKVGPLIEALTVRIEDPRYDTILANAAQSMQNLTGMTADGKQMTSDAAAFVHRELAPARGVWNTLKEIVNQTWAIRGAIGF
jgi:hypothetical protein